MGKKSNNQPTDIVIFVTGLSGVGKSTFINSLLEKPDYMPVGSGVDPCTKELREVEIPKYMGRRVYIVDTPGFNSNDANDLDILKQMAVWLKNRWPKQPIDGGVIYLHNIQDDRYSSLSSTELSMLRNSFGQSEGTFRRIALATTKWHHSNADESKQRQLQLQEEKWKDLLSGGTSLTEFKKNCESARDIVDHLLKNCLDNPTDVDIKAKLDEVLKAQADQETPSLMRLLRSFRLVGWRLGR